MRSLLLPACNCDAIDTCRAGWHGSIFRCGRNKKHRGPSEDRGATPHEMRLVRQLHPMLLPQLWQR